MKSSMYSDEELGLIQRTILKGASPDEFEFFIRTCERTGLDVLARQIYPVRRYNRSENREAVRPQSTVDGFRVVAERSGSYAGQVGPFWCGPDGQWRDVWTAPEPPTAARVGVLRHDFKEPLFAVARYTSYVQYDKDGNVGHMWRRMPDLMLAKVAESLALRRAFPNQLSGLYTREEMDQGDADEVAEVEAALPAGTPPPAETSASPSGKRGYWEIVGQWTRIHNAERRAAACAIIAKRMGVRLDTAKPDAEYAMLIDFVRQQIDAGVAYEDFASERRAAPPPKPAPAAR